MSRNARRQPVWQRVLALAVILLLAGWAVWQQYSPDDPQAKPPGSAYPPPADGSLEVYFLDVGQADSILIRQGGHALLVDAGTNSSAAGLVEALRELGIERFDMVIGTHPHEDHIGGLDSVIDSFAIDTLMMPKIEHDTKTFSDVLESIEEAGLRVTAPRAGDRYEIGEAVLTIYYDEIDTKNLNNCSVVARLDYGGRSLLLTGDAEAEVEQKLLDSGRTIAADFLKVGHHGSSTSSTLPFLRAVNPVAAFITCGVDNSYQHPHQTTLQKLRELEIKIYRTDELGTIRLVIEPDGSYEIDS